MLDLIPQQDMPTDEDVHYWTHRSDEEDAEDKATVRDMLEPQEAFKQCLHCGGAYVEEILDD